MRKAFFFSTPDLLHNECENGVKRTLDCTGGMQRRLTPFTESWVGFVTTSMRIKLANNLLRRKFFSRLFFEWARITIYIFDFLECQLLHNPRLVLQSASRKCNRNFEMAPFWHSTFHVNPATAFSFVRKSRNLFQACVEICMIFTFN